jgi:hypothetical protein
MIEATTIPRDLIGYLTFDVIAHQATLVVCGRTGRPLREVPLVPAGAIMRFFIRVGIRLGLFERSCRAIARDDCDAREFRVWIAHEGRVVVSDPAGERWLRSIGDNDAAAYRGTDALSRPEATRLVRRYGSGDPSRN